MNHSQEETQSFVYHYVAPLLLSGDYPFTTEAENVMSIQQKRLLQKFSNNYNNHRVLHHQDDTDVTTGTPTKKKKNNKKSNNVDDPIVPESASFNSLGCTSNSNSSGIAASSSTTTCNRRSTSPKTFIFDIEGTTTPLPFVTQVLFPYVEKNLASFVREEWGAKNEKLQKCVSDAVAEIQKQALTITGEESGVRGTKAGVVDIKPRLHSLLLNKQGEEEEEKARNAVDSTELQTPEGFIRHLRILSSLGSKAPYFKELQGLVLEKGFRSGELKGHIFSDVFPVFKELKKAGHFIHIYSTGAIPTQKLLFEFSTAGNVTSYIDGYHDTVSAGPKNDMKSYVRIVNEIRKKISFSSTTKSSSNVYSEEKDADAVSRMIFLSDNILELKAAAEAGMTSIACIRPLNNLSFLYPRDFSAAVHLNILSFFQLLPFFCHLSPPPSSSGSASRKTFGAHKAQQQQHRGKEKKKDDDGVLDEKQLQFGDPFAIVGKLMGDVERYRGFHQTVGSRL